ncbi:hypothetical protein [Actinomadura barringtoniae]|uniref:hypothetical protein n=1 Tax=Actinomadura barringtoniae TaxID=1427535 RepID=UPI0027DDBF12|nr:hypothetical protein [Actinomadura barringtoniae]
MRVRFLGSDSYNGQSPTLYETDRGTIVVRGYAITDPQALADLGRVPVREIDIEVPRALLRFADNPMTDDPRYIEARQGDTENEQEPLG